MHAALTETQLLLQLTLMLEYDSDDARRSAVRLTSLDAGVCRGDPARSQIRHVLFEILYWGPIYKISYDNLTIILR